MGSEMCIRDSFRTDPTENVFPMVQAGRGITEMLLGADDL